MILLREVRESDLDSLMELAQIPGFINLPNDRDLLREKILKALNTFEGKARKKSEAKYIFAAEDLKTGRVLGTSMIAGQHGTEASPHFYFQLGRDRKFSETINTGFIHGTLQLKYDTDGPSEIGGLVLDPQARNSEERIGRQISFMRFLFLGLNLSLFKEKVIAELLPPLNKRGQSPLWEAIGRRFTNMDYIEADRLCQKNKEFILSLFPQEKIYTTFLSAEARNAIGKVSKDTEPVVHMLKKIGFDYVQQVDPFDGGPHLWAEAKELVPVKKIRSFVYESRSARVSDGQSAPQIAGLICRKSQAHGTFRAAAVSVVMQGEEVVLSRPLPEELEQELGLRSGDTAHFMPYY